MHIKELGFILQSNTYQDQQVYVLTRSRGKLKMVLKMPRHSVNFPAGTLIAFVIEGERFLVAQELEVIRIPVVQSKRDIAWIHHWLELSFYFSQPELFDEALFQSLSTYLLLMARKACFTHEEHLGIICVFHFLYQTGFYEDYLFERYKKIIDTVTFLSSCSDFDEILNDLQQSVNTLTINEIKQIEFFVLQCLQKHPFFRSFKTMRFVYQREGLRNDNDI